MSPRQLPVVSGKRIVRALEKAGFESSACAIESALHVRSATALLEGQPDFGEVARGAQ